MSPLVQGSAALRLVGLYGILQGHGHGKMKRTDPEKGVSTRNSGNGNHNICRLLTSNFKHSIFQFDLLWQADWLI